MRESHVMIPSKLEQVGQLALNYKSYSRSVHYINGFVGCFGQSKTDRQMDSQNDRERDELTDRQIGY